MNPMELVSWLIWSAAQYGYLGAFFLSVLGNLILFVPVPYLIVVFLLSSPAFGLDPILLAAVSAVGATLGKTVSYSLGYVGRRVVSDETKRQLEFAKRIMSLYGPLAIFLFAATPSPDDVLYVPLGMMGYSILSFIAFCLLGKFVLTLIVTLGARYSVAWISLFFPEQGTVEELMLTLLFVAASVYATMKIDWEKLFMEHFAGRVRSPPPTRSEERSK